MNFSIKKEIILENLGYVMKAISNKNVIPILNGIKFELNSKGLYLTATDSELIIKVFIDKKEISNIKTEGTIIIQSKFLLDIIRKMPGEIINFELIDSLKINIFSENSQYNLNCLDPKEFPQIKIEENKNPLIIQSDIIKNIINQTAFAISNQELRPLLTGINFKIVGNLMEVTATDSYRLAKKNIILAKPVEEEVNVVIPGKNIIEFDKIINVNEELEMNIFNNKVIFKYKNIIFQTNLLNGTYPNTSNLIPNEFDIIIQINLEKYFSAIDRAALLTQNKDKNIVKMKIKGKSMIINSFASEIGKVEEKLNIDTSKDANLEISFSSK